MCSSDLFLGLLAILFPPIAVWVKCGICSADSIINIMLCMLGVLPGLFHAWYIISKYPDSSYEALDQEAGEGQRVTYIVVGQHPRVAKGTAGHGSYHGYGTTAPMDPPVHQERDGTWSQNAAVAASSSQAPPTVPPTYAEAVKGDHKVQTAN